MLSTSIQMILDRLGAPLQISADETAVLATLRFNGGLSQKKISELTSLRRSTLSMMLGRLEKSGLASKAKNPADARSRIFSITEEGGRSLERLVEGIFRIEDAYAEQSGIAALTSIEEVQRMRERILRIGEEQVGKA